MTKEPTLSEVRKLSEKYKVDIEIKFGRKFRTIVSNEDEGIFIKCGWDVNLV